MNKEEIAQYVINNRYPKSEHDKVDDFEMYHEIVDKVSDLIQQQTATLQQELDRLKNPWVPISEYDGKSVVLRWHILWKCPIAVYPKIKDSIVVWYEKTLTTMWPDAAFAPFYMPLPEPPQQ